MKITNFLSNLLNNDIRLWLEDGNLRYSAPETGLPEDIKQTILQRKTEIIDFLSTVNKPKNTLRINPVPRDKNLPLSFSQQRLWLFDQLEPENHAYNIPASLRLEGELDIDALEEGINRVIARHEILRTTYDYRDEKVVQIISAELKISIPRIDLSGLPGKEKEKKSKEYLKKEATTPFNLTNGPLIRVVLLILDNNEFGLLFTMHHIISDDWSLNIFISELSEFYEASIQGRKPELENMVIQYGDYAAWQKEWIENGGTDSQMEYWKENLKNANNFIPFPTDKPYSSDQNFDSIREMIMLPSETHLALKELARKEGTTLYVSLLSAFNILLSQYMGSEEIIIGSPVAGRTIKQVESLIGFFNNTVVLKNDLSNNPGFKELMHRVKNVAASAFANQDLPFELIVEEVLTERIPGKTPIFQVLFNMLSSSIDLTFPGLKVTPFEDFIIGAPNLGAKFDLTFLAIEHNNGLQLDFSFREDVFFPETVKWLLTHFQKLLDEIVNNPDIKLSELSVLETRSYKKIEADVQFNRFLKEDTEQSIVSRFEKIVSKNPDSIAIVKDNENVTYSVLNKEANKLAHYINNIQLNGLELTKDEKSRYARQISLDGWGLEKQEYLKSLTVFAAGAGGSGSPAIMQLALLGIGTIIVCDFDEVDLSNLNRQILHDESRIGMNKAESAAITIKRINPNVNVTIIKEKITRENVYNIIGNSAVIFDNLDDLESKFILSECAVSLGIPHVISSMLERSHYAAIFYTPYTPCFHCLYDINKLEYIKEMRNLDNGKHKVSNPVASPALFACTGFAVNEAIKIILDLENPAYNKYFFFNNQASDSLSSTLGYQIVTYPFSEHFRNLCKDQGFDWESCWNGRFIEEIDISKNPDCPLCSKPDRKKNISKKHENSDTLQYNTKRTQTIALLLGHNISMVKGILGTLKADRTFVTIDPTYPIERINYMLSDCGARVIITEQQYKKQAVDIRDSVNKNIQIIDINNIPEELSYENLGISIDSQSLAYIMYTSGSTGFPKGVMQKHRNVLHYIMNYTNGLHINKNDKLSLIPSFSFSASMMDTFGAILNGASLYIYDLKAAGIEKLSSWLIEQNITVYHSVPTIFRHLTKTITDDTKFPDLRIIDFGGEPVASFDLDLYKKYFEDNCILVNGLGATELNVIRQFHMNKQTNLISTIVPVGYPVEDTEILLLDDNGKNVGFNRSGEIVIKSPYLSPGYWQTEKPGAFKYFQDNDAILFYSGDLGRFRTDGCLEHMGRKDNQLKIRGIRIEPGEIEKVIREMPEIKDAVVIAGKTSQEDNILAAFYVSKNEIKIQDFRSYLGHSLPEYMIPYYFVHMESLPLTTSGKIDRKSLPAPDPSLAVKSKYAAPVNDLEKKLVRIWQEVLGIEKIGINDNFFQIGGDSLLALKFISKASEINLNYTAGQIFKSLTIAELAKLTNNTLNNSQDKKNWIGEVPLTSTQKWYLQTMVHPEWAGVNVIQIFENDLDSKALEESLQILLTQHDILRAKYILSYDDTLENENMQESDKWKQILEPVEKLKIPVYYVDFSDLPGNEQLSKLEKQVIESQSQMDLSKPPLIKVWIYKRGKNKGCFLHVQMHHLLVDGFSFEILKAHWFSIYQSILQGSKSIPVNRSLSFFEWEKKREEYVDNYGLHEEMKFWSNLPFNSASRLPVDYEENRELNIVSSTEYLNTHLSIEKTKNIMESVTGQLKVPFINLIIAALTQTLLEYSKGEWLQIEILESGRKMAIELDVDLSMTVGWLTTAQEFLLNIDTNITEPLTALKSINKQIKDAPDKNFGLIPFIKDAEERELIKDRPNSEIKLNFLGIIDNKNFDADSLNNDLLKFQDNLHWFHPDNKRTSIFGFKIGVINGELDIQWQYSSNLHKKETIEMLAETFIKNIENFSIDLVKTN